MKQNANKRPQLLFKKSQSKTQKNDVHMNGNGKKYSNLEQQYRIIKTQLLRKQNELMNKQKMLKIQTFKNQKLKQQIQQIDSLFQFSKRKITLGILEKHKQNKESPLFYNQNGLSPCELILLSQKRYQSKFQGGLICMICYQDLQQNHSVVQLPCKHVFHKDCAIQHLLGSQLCPSCNQIINLVDFAKKIVEKQEKKK